VAGTNTPCPVTRRAEANFCAFSNQHSGASRRVCDRVPRCRQPSHRQQSLIWCTAGLPNSGPGQHGDFTTPQITAPANTSMFARAPYPAQRLRHHGRPNPSSWTPSILYPKRLPARLRSPSSPATPLFLPGALPRLASVFPIPPEHLSMAVLRHHLTDGGTLSGTATRTLSIANASASDVGRYRVRITNAGGTIVSSEAALALHGHQHLPRDPHHRQDWWTPTVWTTPPTSSPPPGPRSAPTKLTMSPQMVIDASSPRADQDSTRRRCLTLILYGIQPQKPTERILWRNGARLHDLVSTRRRGRPHTSLQHE